MEMNKDREGYKETKVGWIPEEWEKGTFKDICELGYGKDQKKIIDADGKYNILGTGGIMGKTDSFLHDKPSVLIGRKGTINKPMFINKPFWTVDTLFYTKIYPTFDAKWFYYSAKNTNFSRYNEATGVPSLSRENLYRIKYPLPPLPEQKKIAEILSTVDEKIEVIESQIVETERLKKGLMQRLLTEGIGHTEFKDSDIGRIPKSWEIKKLGEYCEKVLDGTHFSPKTKSGPFRYITSKNIKFGKLDLTNCASISEEEHRVIYKQCAVKFGDVLLTKDGAKTGNATLNILHEEFSLLSSVAVIRGSKKLLNEYILQFLLSDIGQKIIKNQMAGQAITRLTLTKINKFPMPIPPITEQKEITDILSTVDYKITSLQSKKTETETLKKGLMQKLLTGQIRVKLTT